MIRRFIVRIAIALAVLSPARASGQASVGLGVGVGSVRDMRTEEQEAGPLLHLRAGWGLISALRETTIQAGVTECSTCKIQMEQGASKPTIHPIKLLAVAYGLMPELSQLLTAPSEELLVT